MAFQSRAAIVLMALLLPVAGFAQSGTSTISGSVTDSTARALPGVAVGVVNEDTGVAVETFTNSTRKNSCSSCSSWFPAVWRLLNDLT